MSDHDKTTPEQEAQEALIERLALAPDGRLRALAFLAVSAHNRRRRVLGQLDLERELRKRNELQGMAVVAQAQLDAALAGAVALESAVYMVGARVVLAAALRAAGKQAAALVNAALTMFADAPPGAEGPCPMCTGGDPACLLCEGGPCNAAVIGLWEAAEKVFVAVAQPDEPAVCPACPHPPHPDEQCLWPRAVSDAGEITYCGCAVRASPAVVYAAEAARLRARVEELERDAKVHEDCTGTIERLSRDLDLERAAPPGSKLERERRKREHFRCELAALRRWIDAALAASPGARELLQVQRALDAEALFGLYPDLKPVLPVGPVAQG